MTSDAVTSIAAAIEQMKPDFVGLSDSIWDFAELKFEERQSAGVLANALEENGCRGALCRGGCALSSAFP